MASMYPLLPAKGNFTQQNWSRPARLWYTAEGRGSPRWEPLPSDLVSAPSGGSLAYLISSTSTFISARGKKYQRGPGETGP
ncbi:hypothetical protein RHSIM_RhsimUnG0158900 [Rhododendron simsii]|uniref:Uncharacterized protein n=1 Tax=Rhododendron simsii TaxID=118357 RepID=A0A834L4I2_RHOSS|nr:hypothetical protein RHSIM_RhsimUnG0158900 [Rhododendron simsii]